MTLEEAQKIAEIIETVDRDNEVRDLARRLADAFPEFVWTARPPVTQWPAGLVIDVTEKPSCT